MNFAEFFENGKVFVSKCADNECGSVWIVCAGMKTKICQQKRTHKQTECHLMVMMIMMIIVMALPTIPYHMCICVCVWYCGRKSYRWRQNSILVEMFKGIKCGGNESHFNSREQHRFWALQMNSLRLAKKYLEFSEMYSAQAFRKSHLAQPNELCLKILCCTCLTIWPV